MAIENGIAITIRAFLHTGKTLDEQFAALTMMKEAHASGDYSKVLAVAQIDEIKAEPKNRRSATETPVAAPVAPVEAGPLVGMMETEDELPEVGDAPYHDPDFSDLPDDLPAEEPALQAAE